MILRFVLWNLADSKTTVQELRRYLRDEAVELREVELRRLGRAGEVVDAEDDVLLMPPHVREDTRVLGPQRLVCPDPEHRMLLSH